MIGIVEFELVDFVVVVFVVVEVFGKVVVVVVVVVVAIVVAVVLAVVVKVVVVVVVGEQKELLKAEQQLGEGPTIKISKITKLIHTPIHSFPSS
jgi:hypothetical protein